MVDTLLSELHSVEARGALAEAINALFRRWKIHPVNQAELLGLKNISLITQNKLIPDDPDVLERAGHLLAIERALANIYPAQLDKQNIWVETCNSELGDQLPLDIMLKRGLEGIKLIREFIESSVRP